MFVFIDYIILVHFTCFLGDFSSVIIGSKNIKEWEWKKARFINSSFTLSSNVRYLDVRTYVRFLDVRTKCLNMYAMYTSMYVCRVRIIRFYPCFQWSVGLCICISRFFGIYGYTTIRVYMISAPVYEILIPFTMLERLLVEVLALLLERAEKQRCHWNCSWLRGRVCFQKSPRTK